MITIPKRALFWLNGLIKLVFVFSALIFAIVVLIYAVFLTSAPGGLGQVSPLLLATLLSSTLMVGAWVFFYYNLSQVFGSPKMMKRIRLCTVALFFAFSMQVLADWSAHQLKQSAHEGTPLQLETSYEVGLGGTEYEETKELKSLVNSSFVFDSNSTLISYLFPRTQGLATGLLAGLFLLLMRVLQQNQSLKEELESVV